MNKETKKETLKLTKSSIKLNKELCYLVDRYKTIINREIKATEKKLESLRLLNLGLKADNESWKEEYDKLAKFTGERFNRSNKTIAKLEKKIESFGESSSDLKTEFMGEFFEEIEQYNEENDCEYIKKIPVSWTLVKQIYKEMCNYVKNRKDGDYRS